MLKRILLVLVATVVTMVFTRAMVTNSALSSGGLLVVANQYEHTVLVVDPEKRAQLAKITVGVNGHEVMVSKDGSFAYVPIYGNSGVGRPGTDGSTVDVIDLRRRALAATIDLGKPVRPHRAEIGPDGLLYVTAELANAVDVLDPSTHKVVAEIPTGQEQSHMLVISPDGRRAYTANVGPGSVSVLDLAKRSLVTTIAIAKVVQRISISPDGRRVFTHDQNAARIAVIDTATNQVSGWIELPASAYASEPTPDGHWLLALSHQANRLYVVDLQTLKITRTFEIPKNSSEILIQPGGTFAYISGTGEGKIAVLDVRAWKMEPAIELTPGVDGMSWMTSMQE